MDDIFQDQLSREDRAMALFQNLVMPKPSLEEAEIDGLDYDDLPALKQYNDETERLESTDYDADIFKPYNGGVDDNFTFQDQEIFNPLEVEEPTSGGSQEFDASSIKGGKSFASKKGIKLSNYGYSSDTTPDSYSMNAIGHANNRLVDGRSVAITKSLADRLGIKKGAVLKINTTKGPKLVTYDDTVPSTDKRTGDLPETIDIYRLNGSNSWGGKVKSLSIVRQGRDGLGGKAYTQFSRDNFNKAKGSK